MGDGFGQGIWAGLILAAVFVFCVFGVILTGPAHPVLAPNWIEKVQCRDGHITFFIIDVDGSLNWSRTNHRCEEGE